MLFYAVVGLLLGILIAKLWKTISQEGKEPSLNEIYSAVVFQLKYIVVFLFLWIRQRKSQQRWKQLHRESWRCIVPSEQSCDLERPQLFNPKNLNNDAIAFHGCSDTGSNLLIRFARRSDGVAEVWLLLRLVDARFGDEPLILTLPEHPSTSVGGLDPSKWSVAGLNCEVREPNRRWRVSYNGWMRWTALSDVFDFETDLDPSLFAGIIASEPWSQQFFDNLRSGHEIRYEQWGQLIGKVEMEGIEPISLQLRGMRDHCFGPRDWTKYERYIANCYYTEDGTFLHVGTVCIPTSTKRLLYGYVGVDSGELYPVTATTLSLDKYGDDGTPPEFFTFSCNAGERAFLIRVKVHTEVPVYNSIDWHSKSYLRFVSVEINGRVGQGFNEFEYRNYSQPMPKGLPTASVFFRPLTWNTDLSEQERNTLIVPLTHRSAQCAQLVGGKAVQLAQLSTIQLQSFSVPKGVCITSQAFELLLKENALLLDAVDGLQKADASNLAEKCQQVSNAIRNSELPSTIRSQLERQLQLTFDDQEAWQSQKFAIRSSAVDEDGDDASSAGQMETLLGVQGAAAIENAVLKCWASAFVEQAVFYRKQTGQKLSANCAVVVQAMVDSAASGVVFSCDPVSGHPGRIVINANYGLGESVVSGQVEPDTIVVERSYGSDHFRIIKYDIGKKDCQISLGQNGGVETVELSEDRRSQLSISEAQIEQLAKVTIEISSNYLGHRDIEWAFDKMGRLYILQARPITTLSLDTEFELLHEFDTAVCSKNHYSTTANVGEVMSGANTPLAITVADNMVDKAVQHGIVSNGGLSHMRPDLSHVYTIYRNHIMLNLAHTLYADPAVVADRAVAELCVLGRPIEDPNLDELLREKFDHVSKPDKFFRLLKTLRMVYSAVSTSEKCQAKYWNHSVNFNDCRSSAQILNKIESIFPDLLQVWVCHIGNTTYSGFWYHIIMAVLAKRNKERTGDNFADLAAIYSSCHDVESAEVPRDLQELSAEIRKSWNQSTSFADKDKEAALDWLQSKESDEAGLKFQKFLERHGHRCIKEIDFYEKAWGENPTAVVEVLQQMLKYPQQMREEVAATDVGTVLQQLRAPLTFVEQLMLKWIIPKARNGVGYREQSKSLTIRVSMTFRKGYRLLAQLLTSEGKLPEAELLYFLTHYEITCLVKERSTQLIRRAQMRRKVHSLQEAIIIPQITIGFPKELEADGFLLNEGELLNGTPVSSGSIKGTVRVALTLDEAKDLKRGEILITRSTDIAWSVYFPMLGGVVTELGGLLSHGAVVAREYGLPCLVSAVNATNFFKTGDIVFLDGSNGTIGKVKESSNGAVSEHNNVS